MTAPSFATFTDLTGSSIRVNGEDNVCSLSPIPAGQEPSGVADATFIQLDSGRVAVRGTVAATQVLLEALVGAVAFATFTALDGTSVRVNTLRVLESLTPTPAGQLPSGVTDGTFIQFSGGGGISVRPRTG